MADGNSFNASEVIIREAVSGDCEQICSLIQELADHMKMPEAPKIDADILRRDGFGAEKMFHCFVADHNGTLVAHALYYFCYSAWEGVNVYLDDLYVSPSYRHHGIGTRMWQRVAQVAVERGCNRLDWVCLGWNESSIKYYKSKGAKNLTETQDWHLFRLDGDELRDFSLRG